LKGYSAAYAKVQATRQAGSTNNIAATCTFPSVASKGGFGEIEDCNKLSYVRVSHKVAYECVAHDYDSIMHYSSDRGALYYNTNILRMLLSLFDVE
jgi:hypothetical protein